MQYKKLYYQKNKGFTLIEVIIYIALFSVIMGGLVVTAYQLTQNTGKLESKGTTQQEVNFMLKKIDWALNGISAINTPLSGTSPTLSVNKIGLAQPVIIDLSATNDVEIKLNGTFYPLTTKNVKVTDLEFTYTPATKLITATVTIDGTVANLTKFLRI